MRWAYCASQGIAFQFGSPGSPVVNPAPQSWLEAACCRACSMCIKPVSVGSSGQVEMSLNQLIEQWMGLALTSCHITSC